MSAESSFDDFPEFPAEQEITIQGEVAVDGRRYILCLNEEQARHGAQARRAIVQSLQKQLRRGDKSLVGNKGYRKYLKSGGGGFEIDEAKIAQEARYDGKWALRTSLWGPADQVALKYKQLWMVEEMMRTIKSILQTRPMYHKTDEAIRGHAFCSFLALVLHSELQIRPRPAAQEFDNAKPSVRS